MPFASGGTNNYPRTSSRSVTICPHVVHIHMLEPKVSRALAGSPLAQHQKSEQSRKGQGRNHKEINDCDRLHVAAAHPEDLCPAVRVRGHAREILKQPPREPASLTP